MKPLSTDTDRSLDNEPQRGSSRSRSRIIREACRAASVIRQWKGERDKRQGAQRLLGQRLIGSRFLCSGSPVPRTLALQSVRCFRDPSHPSLGSITSTPTPPPPADSGDPGILNSFLPYAPQDRANCPMPSAPPPPTEQLNYGTHENWVAALPLRHPVVTQRRRLPVRHRCLRVPG